MTPVSRYSIELTIGASPETVDTADPVEIGTWSPTSSEAVWLLRTSSLGAEMTSMWVTADRASSAAWIEPEPLEYRKLKPGRVGLKCC